MVTVETQWFGVEGAPQNLSHAVMSVRAASFYSYELLDGAYAMCSRREIHELSDNASVVCMYDTEGVVWRATIFTVEPA